MGDDNIMGNEILWNEEFSPFIIDVNEYDILYLLAQYDDVSDEEFLKFFPLRLDEYIKEEKKIFREYYKAPNGFGKYKLEDIAQVIFDAKNFENNQEAIDNHIKNCLIGIIIVLEMIKEEVDRIFLNNNYLREVFRGEAIFLYNMIFQIQEYTEYIMSYKEQKALRHHYSRSQMTASETLYLARRLPRNEIYLNDIAQAPVSTFLIRQSIEIRILELLEIQYVWNDSTSQMQKLTSDVFLSIFRDKSINLPISITLLKKIHAWANPYIHMGGAQSLWETEIARKVIEPFVYNSIIIPTEIYNNIPELAQNCLDEKIREDCSIIMKKTYKKR